MGKNENLTGNSALLNLSDETWFPADGSPQGVLVLTHGLNLLPARMDQMAAAFANAGMEVYRPAFCGHSGDNEKFLNVSAKDWEDDARRIHALAYQRAQEMGLPLCLGAYSFSALVFQVLSAELPFARRLYFAPALAVHPWYPIALMMAKLHPRLTYSSRIFPDYRANSESGARPLLALNDFLGRWWQGEGLQDNAPTQIWLDPRDELVSGKRLRRLASTKPEWKIHEISNQGSRLPVKYHHLVINEDSLGLEEWRRMLAEARDFLQGK
jgi:Serine aminopeptidase, S33